MRLGNYLFICICLMVSGSSKAAWLPSEEGHQIQSPALHVSRTAPNVWSVEVQVPGVELTSGLGGVNQSEVVSLPGEDAVWFDDEHTALPVLSRLIALSTDGDPAVQVTSEDWAELAGTVDVSLDAGASQTITADVSQRQVMGGVSLAALRIHPVKYSPSTHQLSILRSATLRLTESGSPLPYNRPITETIASVLRPVVSNWAELSLNTLVVRGTYLFIVADNNLVQSGIQNLVTWRNRKGYRVEIAGPAQISNWSTSGIKSYIQGRYNAASPPLEFVCLAGDANGSYTVPYYTYGGGAGDWDYTRLDGTDMLPDIAIGRLCFASGSELSTIVNKVLNYERDPVAIGGGTRPNWYEGAGCFAGSGSGISPVQTMQWVRERMLEAGYPSSAVDTVYYTHESVDGSKIQNSINAGVSLWCYRGYIGMSGFEGNDLSGLSNGRRLPFILNLTCGTNDFTGDDITERFVRVSNGGAVAAAGMSTSSTHTRFNNILMSGAIQGLLREGNHTTGGALMRAKLELYRNYPTDSTNVAFFSGITTLIGEPAIDIFTDTPDTLYVNNPAAAPVGTNHLNLTVTNRLGQPVADAYVNLVKGTEIYQGVHTDQSGNAPIDFVTTTAETLFVTATKHNCRPAISYTLITSGTAYVAPPSSAFGIDDDNNGNSSGNGDGHPNPGETIELTVRLRNWGLATETGVNAVISVSDPFVTAIANASASYGTIAPGDSAAPAAPFVFSIASYAPSGHIVPFALTVTDDATNTWSSSVPITLANGKFQYSSLVITGVGNGILDPSESGGLYFWLRNTGTRATPANWTAYLRSADPAVIIWDSVGVFAAANPGALCRNAADLWGIQASSRAYPGERVPLTVIFPMNNGFADTVATSIYIGSIAATAPTPPDHYGYWAFDNTDISYPRHPNYNWVEVDTRYGGSGSVLPLIDDADEHDATTVVNLPFTFQYYGQNFTQIAVCSNGWLAMGAQEAVHTDFRNYTIPSAMGPNAMIAPFWDDLRVPPQQADAQSNRTISHLDQGNDACPATVISTFPYTDTGTTAGRNDDFTGSSCPVGNAPDVIYQITPDSWGSYTISLCGSSYDTGLMIRAGGACPGTTEVACNDDYCGTSSQVTLNMEAGQTYYIIVDGYGTSSGAYTLSVTRMEPAGVYTYDDAANHRFIIEWSRVTKYGFNNPTETFECILYQPGYPPTPTGDGEILFEYMTCTNTPDAASSNDYATVGIENLDQSDGVLYSYYNQVSPAIPGAQTMTDGRAILFTTQKLPIDTPATPQSVTALRVNDDLRLLWSRVTTDVHGDPIPVVQYNIYRSSTPLFSPDSTTFLASASDTSYIDIGTAASRSFYVVQAFVPGVFAESSAAASRRRPDE